MLPTVNQNVRNVRAIIFLVIVACGAYFYHVNFQAGPCGRAIKYHLGTFDEKFGVSRESFLNAVTAAEGIWEKEANKPLFEYSEHDGFAVNLMYDDRQKTTTRDAVLRENIENNAKVADSVKKEFTSLKERYDVASAAYEKEVDLFLVEREAYTRNVQEANKKGGVNEKQYRALDAERVRLSQKANGLEVLRKEVNALAEKRNALVDKYNLIAGDINEKADVINQTAGEKFSVGEYRVDEKGERINIYQFDNRDKMVRVIAHEFGHALGLDHVPDASSVMYELNSGTGEYLGEGDIAALRELCKIE